MLRTISNWNNQQRHCHRVPTTIWVYQGSTKGLPRVYQGSTKRAMMWQGIWQAARSLSNSFPAQTVFRKRQQFNISATDDFLLCILPSLLSSSFDFFLFFQRWESMQQQQTLANTFRQIFFRVSQQRPLSAFEWQTKDCRSTERCCPPSIIIPLQHLPPPTSIQHQFSPKFIALQG